MNGGGAGRSFRNEPALELRRPQVRTELLGALDALDRGLPLKVPVWIAGDRGSSNGIESTDPGSPERLVAVAGIASEADVDAAVGAAADAGRGWADRPAAERAGILLAAGELLRVRRRELAALEVRECAKPWDEADADVCEAIDFLTYYAREAVELEAGRSLLEVPGERNELRYRARGVVAVISPWNFPLAIPTGMVAAALATGNSALLKPAEQSPGCALRLVETLGEAGVPPGVVALLPGYGETGAALVRHPGVSTIAFTGSNAVGLEIIRAAAETPDGQLEVKRVIAEMGGKNCVIVDSDADLDEAVAGILVSAFAYGGQKCSAASRVFAHEAIATELQGRLAGAVGRLVVGQAEDFATDVPPLIEAEARDRVEGYARLAERAGRIAAVGEKGGPEGWFSPPLLAADLDPDSPVLRDEIFGPLLTIEAVEEVEEACDRVDALPFALTGGLFTRSPSVVERVVRRTPVGNLYVNRATTGAMVGRQPFGGNRRSGVGSKAGGPDYLLQFVAPRVVCENTLRHGLVFE